MNDTTPTNDTDDTDGNETHDPSRRTMLPVGRTRHRLCRSRHLADQRPPGARRRRRCGTMGQTNEFNTATNVNYKGATVACQLQRAVGRRDCRRTTRSSTTTSTAPARRLLGVASGNGNQGIGIIGWSKKPLGTGVVGFTGGAGGVWRRVLRRPRRGAPAARRRGADHADQRPPGRRALRGPGRHAVDLRRRRLTRHVARDRRHLHRRRVPRDRPAPCVRQPAEQQADAGRGPHRSRSPTPPTARSTSCPAWPRAVALTVTITETEGNGGFVAVRPAGTAYNGTSSINWFGPNQNLATTVISGLDGNRQVTLRAGTQYTHIVVDVTGYYR